MTQSSYTLWWTHILLLKMAIEIVDFPIKNKVIFHCFLYVHQRVYHMILMGNFQIPLPKLQWESAKISLRKCTNIRPSENQWSMALWDSIDLQVKGDPLGSLFWLSSVFFCLRSHKPSTFEAVVSVLWFRHGKIRPLIPLTRYGENHLDGKGMTCPTRWCPPVMVFRKIVILLCVYYIILFYFILYHIISYYIILYYGYHILLYYIILIIMFYYIILYYII